MTTAISHGLWPLPGGIHPPEQKQQSTALPIQQVALPKQLVVALQQHIGAAAQVVVEVGERVLKGQLIASACGDISACVHAPSSGTVSFIGPKPYPHASGLLADAIVIDTDGLEQWTTLEPQADYRALEPIKLLEKIQQAGISGLGGAGFPSAVKLANACKQPIQTLIINGSECEPYITADDMLMRERASQLVSGIEIIAHLIQPEQVLIGIEDNKPEAIEAVRAALGEKPYQLKVIPTKYPSGGEKQLIQILTGAEVPSGGLPSDIGLLCHNVGTCVAVHDAVIRGRPLISRITTLTGAALTQPHNVEALIGTPINELLNAAGLQPAQLDRLIMGGPMMGISLTDARAPLIKTSNCLLASTEQELPEPEPARPCIRCGDCEQACPVSLLPQQLYFFAQDQRHEQLQAHNLFDCIECGACAYVCPSSIPLVQYYRAAKGEIREQQAKQHKADQARQRFEQRQERLRRAEEQKQLERQARAERASQARVTPSQTTDAATPSTHPTGSNELLKKLKIEASMAQVALKKAEKQLATHNTPELQQQVEQLRSAALNAQHVLDAALADATEPAPVTEPKSVNDEAALKKAKIEAAMLRAQLRKLEALSEPSSEQQAQLLELRTQSAEAQEQLKRLQPVPTTTPNAAADNSAALKKAKVDAAMLRVQVRKLENLPEPTEQQLSNLQQLREQLANAEQLLGRLSAQAAPAEPPSAGEQALKKAKINLALARSELNKAQANGADESALSSLRAALVNAEKNLHQAEEQSGKAPPKLVRTDKRPIDEGTRKLKTDLAFARADLRKLTRDATASAHALAEAEQRIAAIEAQLQAPTARP